MTDGVPQFPSCVRQTKTVGDTTTCYKIDYVVQPNNNYEILMPKTLRNRSVLQDARVTTRVGLLQRGTI